MKSVFKCKACEFGPCYCCATAPRQQNIENIYGEESVEVPLNCPYFRGEYTEWELCAPDIQPYSVSYLDRMKEWLYGDGYDHAPEEIRDSICACALYPPLFDAEKLMDIYNFLRRIEDDNAYGGISDGDSHEKQLKKYSKKEIIAAIFPEAFRAGVCYAEMIRQRHATEQTEKTENE